MIEMALAYVRMGYPVLPCVPATKTPLTRHGLKNATLRPELVRLWWQHAPNANLGLLPPKGVLVLDADSGSAGDRWEASHAEVRAAPRARTPGGGAHYYLRLSEPSGLKARVKAGPEDAPVDVRGLGRAYVLAPPSRT
ncbi:MAG TPA: bifunctional DNA primase/polymerase, partial [Trueperaceae bacterium]